MTVGEGTLDEESLLGVYQTLSLEHALQGIYLILGPTGDVGDGPFVDFAVFSPSFSKEDSGPRVSVWDAVDIHGNIDMP
jgi:hypothetical protein